MIKPLITEKSLAKAKTGRFTFGVPSDFTKGQIKKTIEELFEVTVAKVWTVKRGREVYLNRTRRKGIKPGRKSAILTLKKGNFDFFDLSSNQESKDNSKKEKGGKR